MSEKKQYLQQYKRQKLWLEKQFCQKNRMIGQTHWTLKREINDILKSFRTFPIWERDLAFYSGMYIALDLFKQECGNLMT